MKSIKNNHMTKEEVLKKVFNLRPEVDLKNYLGESLPGFLKAMEEYASQKDKPVQEGELIWKAARETVTLHHYNGDDDRPPIEVHKYNTLQDYLTGNAREAN